MRCACVLSRCRASQPDLRSTRATRATPVRVCGGCDVFALPTRLVCCQGCHRVPLTTPSATRRVDRHACQALLAPRARKARLDGTAKTASPETPKALSLVTLFTCAPNKLDACMPWRGRRETGNVACHAPAVDMCVLSSTLAGAHCTACDADHDAHENELNRLGAQRRGVVGLLDRREPTRAHHGARWRTRKQDHQGVHGHVRMFMGMCVCFPASCLCSLDCGGRCSQSRCDGAATRCCIDTVCASACLHLRRQARAHVQPVATCDAPCLAGWPCLHGARCLRHSTRSIARLLHVHDTHTVAVVLLATGPWQRL